MRGIRGSSAGCGESLAQAESSGTAGYGFYGYKFCVFRRLSQVRNEIDWLVSSPTSLLQSTKRLWAVNLDKPHLWKADIARSVDMYNHWFLRFAPRAFRETRVQATKDVEATLKATNNLTSIQVTILREHPEVLPTLRMCTCPPLAVDRLIGLAGVQPSLVKRMDREGKLPVT